MASSPRICPTCQTSNPPQAAFCFGCGKPLGQGLVTPELLHQRYHLLHKLGTGGFGAVYQAEDTQLGGRLVAVKEMSAQSGLSTQENSEATEAFKKEALLLAELLHPNLARIYDHFSEDGRWYLAMDYIEGETLEAYLEKQQGGSLPLSEALEMGMQLCDVLDYLHTRQPPIIFRDLKPLNIMRTASGHLYLIDFGIARHFKPGQMKDTVAFGSPGYAAPEQYGKTQTTPRSDIYSLGATLHQMLTGIDPSLNPFRFSPLRLPVGRPTPRALAVLVARMVEMDEVKRPTRMSAVKIELQEIAARV
ncbi:MAG TPA: serine/threonine-protein kinase, partial [Ktedonobacteraceae bacterium]|nr:serine/threonine-protein kinase [Ktedonobacteraceae bacterium]